MIGEAMSKRRMPQIRTERRHIKLWILKHEVEDDRFLQIFADFAGLIRRSGRAYEKAEASGNPEYADVVAESEGDYLEEIIGASFVVLQTKIRRVQAAAEGLAEYARSHQGILVNGLERSSVFGLGGAYRETGFSLIDLVWAVGNYYKHRDEWEPEVWEDKRPNEHETPSLRRSRSTRKKAEMVGIVEFSSGNMRRAYEFLGVEPYSACERLAQDVQAWAKSVFETAEKALVVARAAKKQG
jgi:hypothetical protein